MSNPKGNLLLVSSAVLLFAGLLAYNLRDDENPLPLGGETATEGKSPQKFSPPPGHSPAPPPRFDPNEPPNCKQCGSKMALRTNSKTKERFWGCSRCPACKKTQDYLGGPVSSGGEKKRSDSNFTTGKRINASVIRYHLKQYRNPQFWSHQVHENLKEVMPDSTIHSFNRTKGYKSAPDMILASKKSGQKRAYEYQYGKNYKYFEISESRYSDLKNYHEATGNPTFWVMSTGGVPLEGDDRINPSFVPKETFVIPVSEIVKSKRYYIDDEFREKYSFLKHINWVETD